MGSTLELVREEYKLDGQVKIHDLEDNLDLSRLANVTDVDIARSQKYIRAYARLKEAQSGLSLCMYTLSSQ